MQTLFALGWSFPDIAFRGWFPHWLAIVLGLLGMAAVGVLYAYEAGRIGFVPRIVMACVRMGIVVAVTFLLLRPVLTSEEHHDRPRPVAVLIDVSQSMNSADPRPNQPDLWRVAIAYNRTDPNKGIPDGPAGGALGGLGAPPERPTRIEIARAALTNPRLDLFGRLEREVGPVEPATFGSRRDGKPAGDLAWVRTLTGTDPQTALADQVNELLARDPNDLPAAIVLVTDGRENASRTSLSALAAECKRLNVPIHVYGVGSSAYGQLQLRGVDVPEGVFVDDAVAVPVRFRVSGVPRGTATITLKYGERVVATKTVTIQGGPVDRVETLVFVPTKEDAVSPKPQLTATVTVTTDTGGRAETLSDEMVKGVKVVDRKLKVLVIDSLPRFDFKFLQRALLRDRRVEAKFCLTDGDFESMTSGPPWLPELAQTSDGELSLAEEEFRKLLFGFDLLILGDVPAKYLSQRHQNVIKAFVTEGGGLIHQAGRWNAPAGWAGSTLGDVLPVEFESIKFPTEALRRPDPFYPVLVDAAARNPLVSLEDEPLDNAELWGKKDQQYDPADSARRGKKLPPIHWYYPVTKLKPAAEAYLVHPRDKTPGPNPKPMPLLAGHYFGKGFVLFVGFDETWRWRFNEADRYFGRFWSQGVYVAGVPRVFGTKLTQLSIDATDPVQGKTGQVFARVFDPDFKPLTSERVVAQLERLDGDPNDKDRTTRVILRSLPGQPGEYVAAIPFNKAGRFKLSVVPAKDGNAEGLDPADLEYRVSLRPEDELAPGPMDEVRMEKLALETGGRFYREEDLFEMPRTIKPQSSPLVIRTETVLWDRWWVLATLVVLLTAEWVVRKLNSLS